MFTTQQIQELMQIVDYHNSFVVMSILGKDSLTSYDKYVLQQNGIDIDKIVSENPSYYNMYLFGRLSGMLSNNQVGQIDYDDFKKFVKRGQYIPLSKQEQIRYDIAKQRTYNHLKGMSGKQKETVTNIISKEIAKGVEERGTLKSIISEIGHATENWNKDWGRIVDTEMNNIFQQGRAEAIKQKNGVSALVFKDVYSGACRHCIRHYLTAGIGSQPRIFKLDELLTNGSNIGRKQADWLPTVDGMHPHCFDKDTDVFTDEGWKRWPEVRGDEKFLSFDPKNFTFDYVKSVGLVKYRYRGKMLSIKGNWVDLLTTPNHSQVVFDVDKEEYSLKQHIYFSGEEKFVYPNTNDLHSLYENQNGTDILNSEHCIVEEQKYSGFVYDVELEKWHTLFVRRNGVISASGNCRCTLRELPKNYVWDSENNKFVPEKYETKRTVKAILKVGDKEFLV